MQQIVICDEVFVTCTEAALGELERLAWVALLRACSQCFPQVCRGLRRQGQVVLDTLAADRHLTGGHVDGRLVYAIDVAHADAQLFRHNLGQASADALTQFCARKPEAYLALCCQLHPGKYVLLAGFTKGGQRRYC